jgi:hypothetical protein
VVDTLVSLLIVIVIAADLKKEGFMQINSSVVDQYIEWRKGHSSNIESGVINIFRIVQRI